MGMLWKIQKICSTMGTKIFEIDEEMSEIIDAKVGNPQNSTSKKWANFSQPWNLAFFQDYIFKKYVHFQSQRVPKWKIAHIWQSKEQKNKKKTPKNESLKILQSLPDVLQHPVFYTHPATYLPLILLWQPISKSYSRCPSLLSLTWTQNTGKLEYKSQYFIYYIASENLVA